MAQQLNPGQFIAKWSRAELSERAASQSHFNDLCELLGQPTPTDHDGTGIEYTFEKGVTPTAGASRGAAGNRGFADVWWRGKFGWEYKRKDKYRDLVAAYRQLCQYREALENPPLLIVSDIARTEIHTNFTGTVKQVHAIALADMAEPRSLHLLRRIFTDPESFRPDVTAARVTEDVARKFATIAKSLRQFEKGREPRDDDQTIAHRVAHFLMKCMFCLFAEDVDLLPKELFKKLVYRFKSNPAKLAERMTELFRLMQTGGEFGEHPIKYFNGGLFDEASALRLTAGDVGKLMEAAAHDWGSVEPAIFGTLFERSLFPNTRAQIGAHYTSRDDIMLVVEPVVMAPLRREWEAVKADVEKLIEKRRAGKDKRAKTKADRAIEDELGGFVQRLSTVRILDPACGSGNFLYVAIQQLLQLEKEVITFAARSDVLGGGFFPKVRPTQLHGIEINPYAAELAQVVIWIGYLQWMRDNGYIDGIRIPILEPLQTIENRDAILDLSDPRLAKPASWPDADFIIGNPPFLGGSLIWEALGTEYRDKLWASHDIAGFSDLCCYWFELARRAIERNGDVRAGLLATQGIRGEVNRTVLERIKKSGNIFMAWSDRNWILDGAAVHVSIVGFDSGRETERFLDGLPVNEIHPNLATGADTTEAHGLTENGGIVFIGTKKAGSFEVDWQLARQWLADVTNPSGQHNAEALRPWTNGKLAISRATPKWIIDFDQQELTESAGYAAPFAHCEKNVHPERLTNKEERAVRLWWQHRRPAMDMKAAVGSLSRFILTPRVAKHRLFVWIAQGSQCDDATYAFARTDDYFFGVLHSSIHELWARRMGTQLREAESGFRYTPTTCFETFPLPWPPGKEPAKHEAYRRIAKAAKELNEHRVRCLNPPEWIDLIARAVDAEDDFADVPEEARAMIRHSAIMARAAKDPKLKKRTLTNLYNERPTWLRLLHEQLDRAVLGAYALTDADGGWSEDWARVWVDTGAGQPLPPNQELTELRKETDQRVLANLLRMNLDRARK
jgi:hypothetical protein